MPWSKSVLAEIRAARMADGPIIDIDPRPSATMRNSRNLSEFSQPKRENSERFIVLRACFDAHWTSARRKIGQPRASDCAAISGAAFRTARAEVPVDGSAKLAVAVIASVVGNG